ncbi:TPA: hypothetical protein JIF31_001288 [Acinetobacter baumannii]|nr:hypothetical protein [Acinetobacter baumannii]
MKKESSLFTKVNFIEVIRTIPWKNITALSVLFYIAAIWDFFYSVFTGKPNKFSEVNGVFNTLINQNEFLIWIFFIAFIIYFFISMWANYRIFKKKKISAFYRNLIEVFNYTGFFIIEIFYLIAIFCFHTIILTLLTFEFRSTLIFFMFFIYFIVLALFIHWGYSSVKVKHLD